jgi:transcriptional regulator GlxA family with amidase domain
MGDSVSTASSSRHISIGFLLLKNYTLVSLATAVEPLRMANLLAATRFYSWMMITQDGNPVAASDGILIIPDWAIDSAPKMDLLIVVGGEDVANSFTPEQLRWLRKLDKEGVRLGGVCTGAYVLAEAKLLDGCECSVHWDCMPALLERHPRVICNNHLFTVDQQRFTCSGGIAPLDMMLHIIRSDHGSSLAKEISEMFILDRIRDQTDNQKVPHKYVGGITPAKLIEATTLMEANIEEPIPLKELAGLLDTSRRQMERLFKKHLDCSPSRYYLRMRLYRARQLLKQTALSTIEIASMCGFISTPHFSKCYRSHFDVPPTEERPKTS